MDADGLVEARELEDLPEVLGQAVGEYPLVLVLGAHKQHHEQADATAVHVVEPGEVEHDGLHAWLARATVGGHEHVLALRVTIFSEMGGDEATRLPEIWKLVSW